MKSLVLSLLIAICIALTASAQVYVEAPVSLTFTVTTSLDPVYGPKGATLSTTTTKITNQDLLTECVTRGLIPDTSGWTIVVYYDSVMEEQYTGSNPAFRLRHLDGRTAVIDTVLQVGAIAVSGTGKASVSGNRISGSIARRGIYQLTANYQGQTGVFFGAVKYTLKLSGTTNEYYGTAGATSAVLTGYIEDDFDSTATVTMKIGGFKQR